MSTPRKKSTLVEIGVAVAAVLALVAWLIPSVQAQPAARTGIVVTTGPAYAVAPPTLPGGGEIPGAVVGQVCPQDRLVILMLTRQDEVTLWARVQMTATGPACGGNHVQEGAVVFVDTQLLQYETATPSAAPVEPGVPPSAPSPTPNPLNTGGRDLYNCSDFATWEEANAVYQANLPGDPNRLDANNNGIPCEDLPGAPTVPAVPPATPVQTPPPQPPVAPTPTPAPRQCDPAYPTVCIPSPPPDLNCGDIPYTNFTVLPSDPHGFDGDNDGIGCEDP